VNLDPDARDDFDLVGIGQCSIDHVCRVDGIPAVGGKAAMLGYELLPGGQIATALLAAARLGLRTAYVGSVGSDAIAEFVLAPLAAAGVDLAGVRRVPLRPSGVAPSLRRVRAAGGLCPPSRCRRP